MSAAALEPDVHAEHRGVADLWSNARQRCEESRARGRSFLLLLKHAHRWGELHRINEAELHRAQQYRRDEDRHNFVLGRTAVARMLCEPASWGPVPLRHGPNGKPFLANAAAFNLSHAGPYLALGVSATGPIGVDVETLDRLDDPRELFGLVAHPAERRLLEGLHGSDLRSGFRRLWTRKEAILKACGVGLTDSLVEIDTCLADRFPVLTVQDGSWRLVDAVVEPGMAVAVAMDPVHAGLDVWVIDAEA